MAVTARGKFNKTYLDIGKNATAVSLTSDSLKGGLWNNSITPNFDTDTGIGASPYTSNQITGTGYTAGGVVLTTVTYVISSGNIVLDFDDPAWTSATFSGARCLVGYDHTIATPVADPLLFLMDFTADFAVTAGTFTVIVPVGGCYSDDNTP